MQPGRQEHGGANKWQDWHRHYDDPASSLSQRLEVVRRYLAGVLTEAAGAVRLISLCAGDGRDVIPEIARSGRDVDALLVELDADLAAQARNRATDLGLELTVRTADAGVTSSFADHGPADVLLLCGVFGNISTDDIRRTANALPAFLSRGARVIWTRGNHQVDGDVEDPSDEVRMIFGAAGFVEEDFTRPDEAGFRVGLHRWPAPTRTPPRGAERLFTFLW